MNTRAGKLWGGLALAALLSFNTTATTFYVDANGTNPVSPYTDWSTAATNIQDAIDVSTNGDLVLVTNGVYATGGRSWYGSGTNRVTLTNAITLQSVNGPAVTWIVGNQVAGTGSALTNAARCVGMGSMGSGPVLSGFTLTNGEAGTGNYLNGGGVAFLNGINAGIVTNCVLVGNLATNSAGGGAYRCKLINCQITGNSALNGGGAYGCTLINCVVTSNTAAPGIGQPGGYGGGACNSTNFNCIISGNVAASRGGGTYGSTLINCTVVANSSSFQGGGVDESHAIQNCIVYCNAASFAPNINGGGAFTNCCTTPLPSFGAKNITNDPAFVDLVNGDFHLSSNSPCINAGNNAFVSGTNDFDGNPRIVGGTVDIGAYEYQTPASTLSYAWAQQYGLPTDGSADSTDTDGDGLNNWQEWKAGTVPTNAASVLQLASPTNSVSGMVVTWQSVSGITYYLQRSSDLAGGFSSLVSNRVGQAGSTRYTDTSATNAGPYFYRVGVQ